MPVKYPDAAGQPYRPSNGTEGDIFMSAWCAHCKYQDFNDPHSENNCGIINMVMIHDVDDEEYPKEWVYDQEGRPKCTAFIDKNSDAETEVRCKDTIEMF